MAMPTSKRKVLHPPENKNDDSHDETFKRLQESAIKNDLRHLNGKIYISTKHYFHLHWYSTVGELIKYTKDDKINLTVKQEDALAKRIATHLDETVPFRGWMAGTWSFANGVLDSNKNIFYMIDEKLIPTPPPANVCHISKFDRTMSTKEYFDYVLPIDNKLGFVRSSLANNMRAEDYAKIAIAVPNVQTQTVAAQVAKLLSVPILKKPKIGQEANKVTAQISKQLPVPVLKKPKNDDGDDDDNDDNDDNDEENDDVYNNAIQDILTLFGDCQWKTEATVLNNNEGRVLPIPSCTVLDVMRSADVTASTCCTTLQQLRQRLHVAWVYGVPLGRNVHRSDGFETYCLKCNKRTPEDDQKVLHVAKNHPHLKVLHKGTVIFKYETCRLVCNNCHVTNGGSLLLPQPPAYAEQ